jgi:thiol-disulfide isomerase/thioredoxin
MRAGRLALASAALLAAAGCSSSGSSGKNEYPSNVERVRLIQKAKLAPCPPSSTTPVSGGLPDVTLDCLGKGPAVHLGGLTGMPTVVNLWGSWCIPCQQEAKALSQVYDADRGKVRFLGVDTADDPNSALDFGAHVSPPVHYPSVVDPDKKVLLGLAKAPGPPQTVFINPAGRIVHVKIGPYPSAAVLRSDIATYLHIQ